MSISLNVDYRTVKICLNIAATDFESVKELLPQFLVIHAKSRVVFCATFMCQKDFEEFLSSKVLEKVQSIIPINQDIYVSGFGAVSDENVFSDFETFLKKYLMFFFVKKRAMINSLNTLDFILVNGLEWFFRFHNIVPITSLHDIKHGLEIVKETITQPVKYPLLYVNLNKNVSFYKIISSTEYIKLSGSIIGDSTVENLLVLLGIKKDLNSAFKEAYEQGDSIQVDLTVGDIYGDKLDFQLPKNLLAATMGKAQFLDQDNINKNDVVQSLHLMLAINLGMLISLTSENEGLQTVICHSTKLTFEPFLYTLQVVVNQFGKDVQLHFVKHGEYITTLGL